MKNNKIVVEREIKKILSQRHQEIFGKGPEELWVRINRKLCAFYCAKTLTQMEEFLLRTPQGKTEVIRLRKMIWETEKTQLCAEIELKCNIKIISITGQICISTNAIFGVLLLREDFA